MSWKAQHHKIYEARVVADSLARLAKQFDLTTLPFSEEELQTLAKRARESFRAFGSEEKKERLARYKTHLSILYGETSVEPVWAALKEINNEIGYEEK
jgi:thermostable 8-oxoguanine DNA glycosylase